jgi:hypothetical protein
MSASAVVAAKIDRQALSFTRRHARAAVTYDLRLPRNPASIIHGMNHAYSTSG